MLRQFNIVSGEGKAAEIFEAMVPDFETFEYNSPSDYVNRIWQLYQDHPERNNNLNGKIFEYILATLCVREGLLPLYLNARVAFVPNVVFDIIFYQTNTGPICWSVKTSLRERYKQADLEAFALKNVHRKALCLLITLDEKEGNAVQAKLEAGDLLGLNEVVLATSPRFDEIVQDMKNRNLEHPNAIEVISSPNTVTGQL